MGDDQWCDTCEDHLSECMWNITRKDQESPYEMFSSLVLPTIPERRCMNICFQAVFFWFSKFSEWFGSSSLEMIITSLYYTDSFVSWLSRNLFMFCSSLFLQLIVIRRGICYSQWITFWMRETGCVPTIIISLRLEHTLINSRDTE